MITFLGKVYTVPPTNGMNPRKWKLVDLLGLNSLSYILESGLDQSDGTSRETVCEISLFLDDSKIITAFKDDEL